LLTALAKQSPGELQICFLILTSHSDKTIGYAGISKAHELVRSEFADVKKLLEAVHSTSTTNLRSFLGQTPVHFAATTDHQNTVVYITALSTARFELDAQDLYGITPLMYAAGTNNPRAVTALLEAGADINRRDKYKNWTFLDYAISRTPPFPDNPNSGHQCIFPSFDHVHL
jgi:ankyrin repeat protein